MTKKLDHTSFLDLVIGAIPYDLSYDCRKPLASIRKSYFCPHLVLEIQLLLETWLVLKHCQLAILG